MAQENPEQEMVKTAKQALESLSGVVVSRGKNAGNDSGNERTLFFLHLLKTGMQNTQFLQQLFCVENLGNGLPLESLVIAPNWQVL